MRWAISPSRTTNRMTPRTAIVAVVDVRVQRVGGDDAVAVGDEVLDLVAQPRHGREEAGHAARVLVATRAPLPSAAVCSLTKSSVT